MSMPGFTAEASLGRTMTHSFAAGEGARFAGAVVPARPCCSACDQACDRCEACLDTKPASQCRLFCSWCTRCSGWCTPTC
jgi:hypothetical protein